VLVEIAVGIVAALVMVYLRMLLTGVANDRAPYALNFLAIVLATLIGGWRSGLIALAVSQSLVWYIVVPPAWSFQIEGLERIGGLAIATLSQSIILLILGLYQREIDKGVAERERRMELQEHALREIDHRTRNNYSTVLSLVQLQAQRSQDAKVKSALQQVADRIQAIAGAAERLASNSGDIDRIRLDDHLCGLVQQIERGIARDGIRIECEIDEISAGAETATSISIIVNELVTNAIKHAFNGEAPGHVRVLGNAENEFELIVTDNGRGIGAARSGPRNGLGTRLVESFVRQLGAQHEVISTESGTTHRLIIPNLE
jgi:two-component sensor histidine kinase